MGEYFFHLLSDANVGEVAELLNLIDVDKTYFLPPPIEYYKKIVKGYGLSAGVYYHNKLVGIASVVYPRAGSNNLGHFIKLNEHDLRKSIQAEHIFILNSFRGKGLSEALLDFLFSKINYDYHQIFCTIFPKNIKSLSWAFHFGFLISKYVSYHDFPRYLMRRNEQYSFIDTRDYVIKVDEIDKIQQYLDDGFCGYKFNASKDSIYFRKVRW